MLFRDRKSAVLKLTITSQPMKTKKLDHYIRDFFQDSLFKKKGVSQNTMWGVKVKTLYLRIGFSALVDCHESKTIATLDKNINLLDF